MTAEIAILNRQAVALAADSAVTITYPEGPKVYNSVNKLFTLSKYAPVGFMIYGVAELTGVPWETIVKTFREELGNTRFDRLEGYAESLIKYINRHKLMFSAKQQEQQLMTSVLYQYRYVLRRIDERAKLDIGANGTLTEARLKSIANSEVRAFHKSWMEAEPLEGVPAQFNARLKRRWGTAMDQVRDLVFEKIPLGPAASNRLRDVAGAVFSKKLFPDAVSGIVVAGFGEDDYFPRLVAYDVEGVLQNFMKIRHSQTSEVGDENIATLVPFAQREMVDLFMQGIDLGLLVQIERSFDEFVDGLPDVIVQGTGAQGRVARRVQTQTKKGAKKLKDEFLAQVEEHIQRHHTGPIVSAMASLPKGDLAAMAEALVNLTSFKRHVTRDPETVGGPIDVAVISKGDGFVWINRKHYFDPALNHQFFANYFGKVGVS